MASLNAEIPQDLKLRVEHACTDLRTSIKEAVRVSLEEWLRVNTRKLAAPLPSHDNGRHDTVGTTQPLKCDIIHVASGETAPSDSRLDWYMLKIAEILSVISVDDELALRFLIESVQVKVKFHGGSVQISSSPNTPKKSPLKERLAESAIQERVDSIQEAANEHLTDPPSITGARNRGGRKTR